MPDLLSPDTIAGAAVYAALFLIAAALGARAIRIGIRRVLARPEHARLDATGITFLGQLAQALVYVVAFVLYAHLVPALHRLGTALLTGVSVASVVVGLAAQNTLGNLVAGLSILLYRPVRIGDRVQVSAPPGPVDGVVESLSLGYTIIRTADGRRVVVPNSTMATQVVINLNDATHPPGAAPAASAGRSTAA